MVAHNNSSLNDDILNNTWSCSDGLCLSGLLPITAFVMATTASHQRLFVGSAYSWNPPEQRTHPIYNRIEQHKQQHNKGLYSYPVNTPFCNFADTPLIL